MGSMNRTVISVRSDDCFYTPAELSLLRRSIASETYGDIARMMLNAEVVSADELTVSDLLRLLLEKLRE